MLKRLMCLARGGFPFGTKPYHLFDIGVLLFCSGLINYALTSPPMPVRKSLSSFFDLVPAIYWGCAMASAGVVCIVLAYLGQRGGERALLAGYWLASRVAIFWSGIYLLSFVAPVLVWLFHLVTSQSSDGDVSLQTLRSLSAAVLWGFVAHHVVDYTPTGKSEPTVCEQVK